MGPLFGRICAASGMDRRRLAAALMIGQGFCFAAETAAVHHIATAVPLMELAFLRAAAGLVLTLALARRAGVNVFRTAQLPLQLCRGGVGVLYMWMMLFSFSHLPFADATAISHTQAAYIAIFSVVILREQILPVRWLGAGLGVAGALLIAKPAFAAWQAAYAVAVLGASLNGLSFVLNKHLQREDGELTTMFYTSLVAVTASLTGLGTFSIPDAAELPFLGAIMLLGPVGLLLGILALRHAPASVLGPYTLLRLLIGLAGAVLVFGEFPDPLSGLGSTLIVAGCLASSWQGRYPSLARIRAPAT